MSCGPVTTASAFHQLRVQPFGAPFRAIATVRDGSVRLLSRNQIRDETIRVSSDMSIVVPASTPHRYPNTGSGRIRFLAILADADARLAKPVLNAV